MAAARLPRRRSVAPSGFPAAEPFVVVENGVVDIVVAVVVPGGLVLVVVLEPAVKVVPGGLELVVVLEPVVEVVPEGLEPLVALGPVVVVALAEPLDVLLLCFVSPVRSDARSRWHRPPPA